MLNYDVLITHNELRHKELFVDINERLALLTDVCLLELSKLPKFCYIKNLYSRPLSLFGKHLCVVVIRTDVVSPSLTIKRVGGGAVIFATCSPVRIDSLRDTHSLYVESEERLLIKALVVQFILKLINTNYKEIRKYVDKIDREYQKEERKRSRVLNVLESKVSKINKTKINKEKV